jgi:hypothetical protein
LKRKEVQKLSDKVVIKAVVQKVLPNGKHGPFAVASSDGLKGSITFSLESNVWQEDEWPEEGMFVFLGKLRQKRAGWRAKQGRFWKPSDEQTERSKAMEVKTETTQQVPRFLYPKSRQFPFDGVCEQIVRELELRNWQIPGIEIKFDIYGTGEAKYQMVRCIKGDDFKLRFCRVQGRLDGPYNDTAAVTGIVIPEKELRVYNDESGPTFYLYAGKNYERDRERFMNSSKVNSKLNGEPKTYLMYKGGCGCQTSIGATFEGVGFITATMMGDTENLARMTHTHPGSRPPLLVHSNDLGREYDPERGEWNWLKWCRKPGEPTFFFTDAVMEEFKQYLEEVVLKMIVSQSIPTKKVDVFVSPESIPFPDSIGPLFTFGEWRDEARIKQGKEDPSKLEANDRYGLLGSGARLVSLDVSNEDTVPEIAYDGFEWCGIGEITPETPIEELRVPGHHRWSDRQQFVIRVIPNCANGIYIADMSVRDEFKKKIFEDNPEKKTLNNEEYCEYLRTAGRTIIPITEYRGDYKQPVVLINRELSLDEVEMVSGPHTKKR